jgi:8-oxo-dGTP pyrophosphatase MutT (NUDIX family)
MAAPSRALSEPGADLPALLLDLDEAAAMDAAGGVDAAVLVPLFDWPDDPGLIFTERRADLRRHAGEISFPGGRQDPGESHLQTAVREAHEEIGLAPDRASVVGALPPIGTFVTNYKVHPIVALVDHPEALELTPSPAEVETVLAFTLDRLRDGFAMRRLVRRGIPIRTPTYVVDEHLIWGATARILGELLARIEGANR